MIDLHSHILPGMDDGSATPEESLAMLRMMRDQGITEVVATPHFDCVRESVRDFAERQAESYLALKRLTRAEPLPRIILGAEVYFRPALCRGIELEWLRIGKQKTLLLELPFEPWSNRVLDKVYELVSTSGITPILAHIERYIPLVGRTKLDAVLSMGAPVQMNASYLLSRRTRRKALSMLQRGRVHLLASDCHNLDSRPPELGAAMEVVRQQLGEDMAQRLTRRAMELAGLTKEAAV